MRKLQYLFMTLSVLFLAAPAFAQTGEASTGAGLTAIAAGIGMGIAAGLCGLGQGRATASGNRGGGTQPRSSSGYPAAAGTWPGVYGVTLAVHLRDHFLEGSLEQSGVKQKRSGVVPDLFLFSGHRGEVETENMVR